MTETYDHRTIEQRWRARWAADPPWRVDLATSRSQALVYNLVEFPYPSAEGLHVGHAYTYSGADTYGRYLRMRGAPVFQPIGFDAFGIHTENYALKVGRHPMELTRQTIEDYRGQLCRLGAAWDWEHEIVTSDPSYYRWTQWILVQLFRAGLMERKEAPVVWCPSCLTVLAYEQLEGERCERCGNVVTERRMLQWFLKITEYADRLLEGLTDLDWPEVSKTLQRAWIGRSDGVEVDFAIAGSRDVVSVYTTRVDTLFGVSFLAVAPGSALAEGAAAGTPTGTRAIHPLTGAEIPIWVAEHVVETYGTGMVMGVPAHDARDFAFARAVGLPVVRVVAGARDELPWTEEGRLVSSGEFDGQPTAHARGTIADHLEQRGSGRRSVRYRLHDWLISRQRYWGPPIPIVHCPACGPQPVPEADLPVVLPYVEDFRPTGTGTAPLAAVAEFVRTECPACGGEARRETDVSDTFVDSAWYFLRYPSSDDERHPWDPEVTARVLPVDLYAGGREHVVRHHLYARFVTMALHDLGLVPFAEPFPRLLLHGLLVKDGAKMSKSRGNVVNPDTYVERVGSDTLRMYLLFCGDWQEGGDFTDAGIAGIERLVARVWRLVTSSAPNGAGGTDMRPLGRAVDRIGRDLERLHFNTAIAAVMEVVRWIAETRATMSGAEWDRATTTLTLVLAPFAPHLTEELWERLGGPYSVHTQPWPAVDLAALERDVITLVVQIDGKVRDRIEVPVGLGRDAAVDAALASDKVRRHLDGRTPAKVVHVEDRLVNLVT
jgi:leucyl-tRNA synthetase